MKNFIADYEKKGLNVTTPTSLVRSYIKLCDAGLTQNIFL